MTDGPDGPGFLAELVHGYFGAVADGRWDDVLGLFHDDAELNVRQNAFQQHNPQLRQARSEERPSRCRLRPGARAKLSVLPYW